MGAQSASGRSSFTTEGTEGHRGSQEPPSQCVKGHSVRCIAVRYNMYRLSLHDRIHGMKKLTLADYRALAEFRYQIREFFAFSDRAVQAAGLERGQYQLMLAIKGMPEGQRPRIRELANQLHVQHHSAVELINRLEAGGYVRRERTEEDRREVLLALTPKGENVLAELALHHHEELQEAAPRLVASLRRVMAAKKEEANRRSAKDDHGG
jgi:DNA-binding MarR family transcriptional regulator